MQLAMMVRRTMYSKGVLVAEEDGLKGRGLKEEED